jgi:hypothetical protein
MHTAAKVTIGLGIIITLAGIYTLSNLGENTIETFEEGILYEGADGEMKITDRSNPDKETMGLYVHIQSTYEGGGEGGYNERHGNYTWNLTESDCNLIKTFTLTHNEDDTQVFIPRCTYIEDDGGSAQDDDWIVVGTLCTQKTAEDRNLVGDGCRDGTYTWDTGGEVIMVYDLDKLIEGIFGAVFGALGSFGACCCGSIILIIGIILGATMDDPKEPAINATMNTTNSDQSYTPAASGWDQDKDYIHRNKEIEKEDISEKSEMAVPESEEGNKSGEYKIPPPE